MNNVLTYLADPRVQWAVTCGFIALGIVMGGGVVGVVGMAIVRRVAVRTAVGAFIRSRLGTWTLTFVAGVVVGATQKGGSPPLIEKPSPGCLQVQCAPMRKEQPSPINCRLRLYRSGRATKPMLFDSRERFEQALERWASTLDMVHYSDDDVDNSGGAGRQVYETVRSWIIARGKRFARGTCPGSTVQENKDSKKDN